MFHPPQEYRFIVPGIPAHVQVGNNGMFQVPVGSMTLRVIASDGEGWEHVSVSLPNRCPSWGEMCAVKALFWDDEDTVMQLHPPKSEWISNHQYCLHLWRPIEGDIPRPPAIMVGVKELGTVR